MPLSIDTQKADLTEFFRFSKQEWNQEVCAIIGINEECHL
jgi:hypothetical protein